jgi:hypothetical protein
MTRPPDWPAWPGHFGAFVIYAVLAVIFIDHGASVTKNILGFSSDPYLFTWFLAWWPWAVMHHLDPLYTNLVWQPAGLHIAWTTCIPLLAFIAAPVTLAFSPAVAFNVLNVAAPVLSAGAAYLLCLRLTRNSWAALIGGYLFGFSSYEMAETLAHLNLDFCAALPLLVLVVLNRLEDRIGRMGFVVFAAILLAAEFYISAEVFATEIFFGGVAWLLALGLLPGRRGDLWRLGVDAAAAAPFALLLTAPLLWPMLTGPRDIVTPRGWAFVSSAHFFNLLVPTPATVLAFPAMQQFSRGIFGIPQADFSSGLPLLLILVLAARAGWQSELCRFAFYLLAIIFVASLGPQLWFGPVFTRIILPWFAVLQVPLLGAALPVRFALYSSLLVALIAAVWIAGGSPTFKWRRIGLGVLACAVLAPAPHPVTRLPALAFFAPGEVQRILGPNARLLLLRQEADDPSAFWQAAQGFGFAQSGGYLGFPPQSARFYPAVADFSFGWPSAHLGRDIADFCFATKTQFVVAGPATAPGVLRALAGLAWPEQKVDGVMIFAVPPGHV